VVIAVAFTIVVITISIRVNFSKPE